MGFGRYRLVVFGTGLVTLCLGCTTQADNAKLARDQARFEQTVKSVNDDLQRKIDDATAARLFARHYSDAPDEPTADYFVFRKCHDDPPKQPANQKRCAVLQARVAKAEAAEQAKERAW
jgi:hypothetical protein